MTKITETGSGPGDQAKKQAYLFWVAAFIYPQQDRFGRLLLRRVVPTPVFMKAGIMSVMPLKMTTQAEWAARHLKRHWRMLVSIPLRLN